MSHEHWVLSSDELTELRDAQEAHMPHTCTIDRYTAGAAGTYGLAAQSYVSDAAIKCELLPGKPKEVMGVADVPAMDAIFRLPHGSALTSKDRLTLITRYGVAVSEEFEVVGRIQQLASCVLVEVKRVNER